MAVRAYKFRLYPSGQQEKFLLHHLALAKNLWNELLAKTKKRYEEEKKFYSKSELHLMAKGTCLYSQTAQAVSERLHDALRRKTAAKRQGRKFGFPRFKTLERMKSLSYPQSGFSLGKKLKVSPFGEIPIRRHRAISGRIKTLTIKRESSGRWFAIFCAEIEQAPAKANSGPKVGIDLGLKNFATLSDGRIIKNPRHLKKMEKKLAFLQMKLSKKKKGSKMRQKAKLRVARAYERLANIRHDFLHKTANGILSAYSLLALEKLKAQEMAQKNYGKWINDAAWKTFSHILAYKAESAGCKVFFVEPEGTTQECSACGTAVSKSLGDRKHVCWNCGLVVDRDINASINILKRATVGTTGSNACGDERKVSSLKQDAAGFSPR